MKLLFRKLGINQNHKSMGNKTNNLSTMGVKLNHFNHRKEHSYSNEEPKEVRSDLERSRNNRTNHIVKDGQNLFNHR